MYKCGMSEASDPVTRIASLRRRLGWPQQKMATYLGVSQPTVVRLERGRPEPGPVAKLLDLLAADVDAGVVHGQAATAEARL